MSSNQLNAIKLQQIHLALKDAYTLVMSVNYSENTYSVIDSEIPSLTVCDNAPDFLGFATKYFEGCHREDLQNYPLICDFEALVDHLQNNKGNYTFEVRLETLPYVFNWFEGTYFLVDNPENDDIIFLLLFKDINHRKLIEENLKDAFVANEIAAKAKTDFLSRMSNDIRTPISLIVSMIELARNNIEDTDKVMDCLVKMDISSRYLFQLIDNVLDMSQIEAGKFNIDNSPFNIKEVLDELEKIYAPQAESNQISFKITENVKGLINLVGDAFRIKQVLKNLISNSFKYTPIGGSVHLNLFLNKVIYNKAFFSFTVENNGPSIDESQLDRLFQPFEKGYLEPKMFDGIGLGLSICKNTIELLGGTIKAYNNPDKDCVTFEIEVAFDLDEENSPEDINFLADDAYIRFPKRTVLLAESDPKERSTIQALLEARGIVVEHAIDGFEVVKAFEQAPAGHFDLILLDVDLPAMSGADASMAIRNSFQTGGDTIPIIGMSVDVLEKNVAQAFSAGMTEHIAKPINVNKLFTTLKNYM